jgi:hypothetical protein
VVRDKDIKVEDGEVSHTLGGSGDGDSYGGGRGYATRGLTPFESVRGESEVTLWRVIDVKMDTNGCNLRQYVVNQEGQVERGVEKL